MITPTSDIVPACALFKKMLTNIQLYYNIVYMKNVIENVLYEYADMQLNLESKAARKFLAEKINIELLNEIKKRLPDNSIDLKYINKALNNE